MNGCSGFFKRSDVKDNPVNVNERVKKNIQEGKGIRFGKGAISGGNFDFASSNELWRASLDTLDFMPLLSANYSGGVIITDWYSTGENINERCKLNIFINFNVTLIKYSISKSKVIFFYVPISKQFSKLIFRNYIFSNNHNTTCIFI